ncbi:MAG: ammonium transporter, partial [Alphaproteobacteria bacterium]|nr:ammonium transporter [Alphaproteobacteria bacterium]
NTAWILTATALVLFMTLPGLALFYGGLVHTKNVLSVLMHCFAVACLSSVLWLIFVYSLTFGDGGGVNGFIGGFGKAFLMGVSAGSLYGDIPESVFFMFQMTFAIITPALIVGAFAERMKFSAVLWFSGLWLVAVYAPAAHWIWGGGMLAEGGLLGLGVRDFAGGVVVHVTAGTSALVAAVMVGKRRAFPAEITPPHSPVLTMMGAGMLWVGWFGFNAGSALTSDGAAGMAMLVTHISAATASLVWMGLEWVRYGKPSLIGIVTGMVAGLATITPASGYVGPLGGVVCGLAGGTICFFATPWVKHRLGIDDSLDVFAVHGVGGITGTMLTAVFALPALGGLGLAEGATVGGHLFVQAAGIVIVAVWSVAISFVILKALDMTIGLRVSRDVETEGLDINTHGERGYSL